MRSPLGPILVLSGLATVVVLVLLLFQSLGLRSDLESARAEIAELRTTVENLESDVSNADVVSRLDELEVEIRDLLPTGGGSGSPGGDADVSDRLDEILAGIEALESRVDEICDNIPVC